MWALPGAKGPLALQLQLPRGAVFALQGQSEPFVPPENPNRPFDQGPNALDPGKRCEVVRGAAVSKWHLGFWVGGGPFQGLVPEGGGLALLQLLHISCCKKEKFPGLLQAGREPVRWLG